MSDVSHGVNAGKTDSGAITPVSVDTGVHFVVGTAPVQATNGFQSTLLQEERQQKCTIFLMHLCNNYCIVSI